MPRPKTVGDGAVLDAAHRVVDRAGPGGLTLAAVAREVGLAPATLIQRFGSKRGLLLAIARRAADDGGAPLREAARRHRRPLRALVAGLVEIGSAVSSPESLANQLAFLQIDLSDPEFHVLALAHAQALRREIAALLESAVSAGELRAQDTARLAQTVQTTYNGALITWGIYRRGTLASWMRRELESVLAPHRTD
ncbi:MAG TPA: helix-turn-helix domain-containing protein [Solirubrobacteraceae bacterium]|nr:helix-turn-helix domain-containing protein [Solirubrobacteraceae bacterium]